MGEYLEKFERMLSLKEKELAVEIMTEAQRRSSYEDWLIAYIIENTPISFSDPEISLEERAQKCALDSGASLLELANAYRSVQEKYRNLLSFSCAGLTLRDPVPFLPNSELKKFVRDFCDGKIFTSAHIKREEEIPLVFMCLFYGSLSDVDLSSIGIAYEYLTEALPRSINGYPMFCSLRFLNIHDWNRCQKAILKRKNEGKTLTPNEEGNEK